MRSQKVIETLSGRSSRTSSDDVTQEITVPIGARSKRSALALLVVKGPHAGEVLTVEGSHAVIGRGLEADLRIEDPSLSRTHARFDREGDTLAVTDLESRNGTFVEGQRLTARHRLKSGELITLGSVVLRFALHDAEELELTRSMYEAAVRDRLTGLYNRGYFDDRMQAEYAFVKRHGGVLAVMLIDLDHFKKVNDGYGHAAGDAVLGATAKVLVESLRAEDVAARYGGEEFAVIARGSDASGAQVLAERLRARIAQTSVQVAGRSLQVTASIGVALLTKELQYRSPADLVAGADASLYESKGAGRDRVTLHQLNAQPSAPKDPQRFARETVVDAQAKQPEQKLREPAVDGSYSVRDSGGGNVDRVRPRSKR
ncbi:MAG: GGDEF domain-containing protein [Myxococcales bacterium]